MDSVSGSNQFPAGLGNQNWIRSPRSCSFYRTGTFCCYLHDSSIYHASHLYPSQHFLIGSPASWPSSLRLSSSRCPLGSNYATPYAPQHRHPIGPKKNGA